MYALQWFAGLTLIVLPIGTAAQERGSETSDDGVAQLRKLMDESLNWYEVYLQAQPTQPLVSQVVLRWTNNARGSGYGMTVIFLAGGRPEVVCCIYPWNRALEHNFESISRGHVLGKKDGRVVWQPKQPGVHFQPIPDAPAPADTPAARLRQMKLLASRFSSTLLGWRVDNSDQEKLRLLPQPLYRYESKRPELLDGSLFAFVQGTDPETLLLIEAVKADEAWQWQFAFVRRTSGELEGRFRDQVVWHAARYPANNDPTSTYISLSQPLSSLLPPPE